jgi:hypothetical protein
MRADRDAFNHIVHGDVGALAAVVRGSMIVSLGVPARFNLLTRLFAGPPESRKHWIRDERWQGERRQGERLAGAAQ